MPILPNIDFATGGGGGSGYNVNLFTLSAGDIAAKSVTLSAIPTTPGKTILSVIDGDQQDYGIDFSVSGTTLSWASLGLDGVLVEGDKLVIQFN
jgi:hypothetical protein